MWGLGSRSGPHPIERLPDGRLAHEAEGAEVLRAVRARPLPPEEAAGWPATETS
ncbi:hypothetical protein OG851_01415 [Streptomyces sp. NBC_00161]|uniref:hypothetical protein n=1 Tax=Streptomyces sp. NBC_00161 TaxID=2975671 RepID=UPI003251B8B0